jgi:hypothetical protein
MVNTPAGYNSKRLFRVQVRASVESGQGIGDEIEEGLRGFSETLILAPEVAVSPALCLDGGVDCREAANIKCGQKGHSARPCGVFNRSAEQGNGHV